MITTSQGLDEAISFVTEEGDPLTRSVSADMDAAEMNSIFEEIEDRINNLYEKTRTLEDIKNYIQDFLKRAIDERRKKIVDRLRVIEHSVDDFQNTENISISIGFDNITTDIKDRDGTIISSLVSENGTLIMPNKTQSTENILSITNKSVQIDAQPYNEKILDGVLLQPFRGIYEAKQPVEGGLTVTYEILFKTRSDCNYFNVYPANCTVEKIILTDFTGNVQEIDPAEHYFMPSTNIYSALITINCSNYDRIAIAYATDLGGDSFDKSIVGSEMT